MCDCMKKLSGKFFKAANGHESYDIGAAEPELFFPVATKIQNRFGFEPPHLPIFGLDVTYLDLIRDNVKIIMGWDIWSGLFIFAEDREGDVCIREIGKYLESISEELYLMQEELVKRKQDIKNEVS